MIVAMTGTRQGMTVEQASVFRRTLTRLGATRLVHGNAVGADAEASRIAASLNIPRTFWPSNLTTMQVGRGVVDIPGDVWHRPKPPLTRNKDIVDEGEVLIAIPKSTEEELRSGTWAAVRYARRTGKRIIYIWPDGTHEEG